MKYYAVKVGRNPGIYKTWNECFNEINKYSNAIYKSFKTYEEAKAFLEGDKKNFEEKLNNTFNNENAIAYVDGSYNLKEKIYGSGVVLFTHGEKICYSKKFSDEFFIHRNVAGELKATEIAIDESIKHNNKSVVIYHDYQGISSWAKEEWKANNDLTKSYKEFISDRMKKIEINFVKVKAHSNNENNDLADKLAKKAIGIGE
ncbi:MAG: ribonuclease H family protein [Peptoniphilaceae bacterium]|nr:ribonuclease H family protein [Peptoniphilaceae bacterium]MDD7382940.1 ribonuclease H family protein [Peptoniphilaceae bacterium]MDY3737691.1 ribonuclease H family protein [Peptoniphilaceae bacterium]